MPMTLLEMLYQQYGTNEPILLSEITFEDYSRPWIMKQLQLLCESGDLCKYEKGVYYGSYRHLLWKKHIESA